MTVASKRHLERIHTMRCVICSHCYGRRSNAQEAHHIESVRGEHSDFATVPLCEQCHRQLHAASRKSFYIAHKLTDVKLLAYTIQQLLEDA